ncbi:MAG: acetate uptake transporter [Promethearchaeota archaeon]
MSEELANPAPLGLMCFGMTTVLLNLHNAGLYVFGTMILSMGLLYGGMAQIIAGIMEYKKGNTFGTTVFISYGTFWMTLVFLKIMPNTGLWDTPPDTLAVASYLIMWGIFSIIMFLGTFNKNRTLQIIFITLIILFFLLAIGDITGLAYITIIAGYEGIVCGSLAIYLAMAEIINENYGRDILPIG